MPRRSPVPALLGVTFQGPELLDRLRQPGANPTLLVRCDADELRLFGGATQFVASLPAEGALLCGRSSGKLFTYRGSHASGGRVEEPDCFAYLPSCKRASEACAYLSGCVPLCGLTTQTVNTPLGF